MRTFAQVIAFGVGLAQIAGQAEGICLSLAPQSPTVECGETTTVDLVISGFGDRTAPSLGAYSVGLSYDASLLEGVSVVPGEHVTVYPELRLVEAEQGWFYLFEVAFDEPAALNASQPGTFSLASFHLKGLAGGRSVIQFDPNVTSVSDEEGNSLSFATRVCEITVIDNSSPPAAEVILRIEPPSPSVERSQRTHVDVVVCGLGAQTSPSVGAYSIAIVYDPAVLAGLSITPGAYLATDPELRLVEMNSGWAYVLEVSPAMPEQLNASQPASFTLATLEFEGLMGGSTTLEFDPLLTSVSDENGVSLPFLTTGGTITVLEVNEPPTAYGQSLTTYDKQPLEITLSGFDMETDDLQYRISAGPTAGSLSGTPPNVMYTPPFPYTGKDLFVFEVEDEAGATAAATIEITILPSVVPPVAAAGEDQIVFAGMDCLAAVTVSGSVSGAPDGTSLIYGWEVRRQGDLVATATGAEAVWKLPVGNYEATLTVEVVMNGVAVTAVDSLAIQVLPSAPTLAGMTPTLAYAEGPGFELMLTGGCFPPDSTARWNGEARATTWISHSELVASIPAADLVTGLDVSVAIVDVVAADGGVSNPLAFSVVRDTVGEAQASIAQPGETTTVSTAPANPGEAGVAAVVDNTGAEPVTVLAATYVSQPAGATDFKMGDASFVDVQILGADESVSATLSFYYPSTITGGKEVSLKLYYYNGGNWVQVRSSGDVVPVKDTTDNLDGTVSGGRFTVIVDSTSTPKISELEGTAFGAIDSVPQIQAITGISAPVALGTPITLTVEYAVLGDLAQASVEFAWDDGTPATVILPDAAGRASASHLYTATGIYGVTVRVTDAAGDAAESRYEYVVVYDPSGGFVTGGGWIESAAGAYPADPRLTGRANFGFVSKYQKGAQVPTGTTEFQFQAAAFAFKSTRYEWLVVSGAKAQYKGIGQVDGAGDYGFLLTVTDGQLAGGGGTDKFRIKIWERQDGVVVYDNRLGVSDDLDGADPQVLGGGSIVIHRAK